MPTEQSTHKLTQLAASSALSAYTHTHTHTTLDNRTTARSLQTHTHKLRSCLKNACADRKQRALFALTAATASTHALCVCVRKMFCSVLCCVCERTIEWKRSGRETLMLVLSGSRTHNKQQHNEQSAQLFFLSFLSSSSSFFSLLLILLLPLLLVPLLKLCALFLLLLLLLMLLLLLLCDVCA